MNKKHISLWLKPSTIDECEANMKLTDCSTRSKYLEQAIEFYNGYLHDKNNEEYVSKVIITSIDGIMKSYEDRTSRIMFKQAVEMAKIFKLLVQGFKLSDEQINSIHGECVQEVKKINGALMYPMKTEKSE